MAKERTRDDLIDSIIHTRTKEHRVMPGFLTASRSVRYIIICTSELSVGLRELAPYGQREPCG